MDRKACYQYSFGADYYPEHWPEERWETDAKLMKELGLQIVRMAEFSWKKMEPSDGIFDFSRLDRIVSLLGSYGIKTVLGTPTAAPPAWLCEAHPEILPVDSNGLVHGFGGRHHDCHSNETYRTYCGRIVTKMAEHFRDNPNVIGWQIDNELGNSHDDFCHCKSCRKAFEGWLEKKYKTVDSLNTAWGTAFWSQGYNSFSEIPTPTVTAVGRNPGHMLDFRCFHSDLIVDFCKFQADIIRNICPEHFITHNCMDFSDTVDYYRLGKVLDFACQDQYPLGYWLHGGFPSVERAAGCLDVVRSFRKEPIWIMEQEAGMTGWGSMGRAPQPGQLREMTLQSVAHGADTVVYFRWRSCSFGTEEFWHGILPHSGIPGRSYEELKSMISALRPVMEEMKGAMPKNPIGIVYSYPQMYALRDQRHNENHPLSFYDQMLKYYGAAYHRNVGVDFIGDGEDYSKPESAGEESFLAELRNHKLVIAPVQYLVTGRMAAAYETYVAEGGTLVLTMRAGVKEKDNRCYTDGPLPGRFRKLAGLTVLDYDCLTQGNVTLNRVEEDKNSTDVEYRNGEAVGEVWADLVTPDADTRVLYSYASEWYAGTPAVTVHPYGKGRCVYVGTEPDSDFTETLMKEFCGMAGIEAGITADPGVEVSYRFKENVCYTFIVNTGDRKTSYRSSGEASVSDLLGERIYADGPAPETGTLAPFETHIFRK